MSRLLPYETILKAREGDPEAVNAVLLHYAGYIRYFSKVNGQVNAEVAEKEVRDVFVKHRILEKYSAKGMANPTLYKKKD